MLKSLLGKKERRGHTYFSELARITNNPAHVAKIKEAIEKNGYWESSDEWRISTVTNSRIEPIEERSHKWFRVTVKCDHEFRCHTQTIERAAFFAALYQVLIMDMFYNIGWASSSPDLLSVHEYVTW